MENHKKIYIEFFDYAEQDKPLCESCMARPIVDIHHIDPRGMGGTKQNTKDFIENLAGLCRECHNKAEASKSYNETIKAKHLLRVKLRKVITNKNKNQIQ